MGLERKNMQSFRMIHGSQEVSDPIIKPKLGCIPFVFHSIFTKNSETMIHFNLLFFSGLLERPPRTDTWVRKRVRDDTSDFFSSGKSGSKLGIY